MIMNIDLTGVYVVGVLYLLAVLFLLVALVTGAVALVQFRRTRGAPLKRVWGFYCLAALIVAAACYVVPNVIKLPVPVVEWIDEHYWVLVPGPIVLFWGIGYALRASYVRSLRKEERSRGAERSASSPK